MLPKEKKFNDAQLDELNNETESEHPDETRIDVAVDASDGEQKEHGSDRTDAREKKIKNLTSLAILLGGLFLGSLFVDIVQLMQGGGFSQRAIMQSDVLSAGGKTWVAFSEPIVTAYVVSDETCADCNPDEALLGLKRVLPTMLIRKVDAASDQGKDLIAKFNLKTIPAFIFSKEIEKTEMFTQAQSLFDKQGDRYALKTAELGLPAGKYVQAPTVSENDIKLGPDDAKVKIVEFTDFQCPYCKQMHEGILSRISQDYADQVQIVFKNLPLDSHPAANPAALAGACASEQGKFPAYADKLFASQDAWGKSKDPSTQFKTYASQSGLDIAQFSKCLSEKKYQSLIDQTMRDAQEFGIQGTPVLFVGSDEFLSDAAYDDVKKAIDDQLAR